MTEAERERRKRFEALFREHVVGIASYCRWQLRSAGDAEDAVADVFLVAWRRLDHAPRGEAARPWLYATARRVVANQARSAGRRTRLQNRLNTQTEPTHDSDAPSGERVQEALATLQRRDREILLLAEYEGFTPAEIAAVMGRPVVTIRGRLHRARRRFRAAFEAQDADPPPSAAPQTPLARPDLELPAYAPNPSAMRRRT